MIINDHKLSEISCHVVHYIIQYHMKSRISQSFIIFDKLFRISLSLSTDNVH